MKSKLIPIILLLIALNIRGATVELSWETEKPAPTYSITYGNGWLSTTFKVENVNSYIIQNLTSDTSYFFTITPIYGINKIGPASTVIYKTKKENKNQKEWPAPKVKVKEIE